MSTLDSDANIGDHEGYYLLGCDKRDTDVSAKLTNSFKVRASALLAWLFDREDAGSTFFKNINELLQEYTMSHPSIQRS
jgi:hypothetical protein